MLGWYLNSPAGERDVLMTVTDVMCDLCYRQFVASAVVALPAINGRRSHVCQGCTHTLLRHVGVSETEATKVNQQWPR